MDTRAVRLGSGHGRSGLIRSESGIVCSAQSTDVWAARCVGLDLGEPRAAVSPNAQAWQLKVRLGRCDSPCRSRGRLPRGVPNQVAAVPEFGRATPSDFSGDAMRIIVAALLAIVPLVALAGPQGSGATAPTWHTLVTEAYPKKRDDIVFVDAQTGFYGTGKGMLYRTQDAGRTWQLVWSHPGTFIRSLAFVDAKHGFIGNLGVGLASVTDPVALYETRDGGLTWRPAHVPAIPGICSIDVMKSRSIHEGEVSDRFYVHAAGRADGPAKLLRSEDGGETWTLIDLSERAGMILDVKFLDPNTGFVFAASSGDVAQSNALILKTNDGGRTWREVYRSARLNEITWKASFASGQVGYVTLQNNDPANTQQRVAKTTDGGEHWTELPLVDDAAAQEFGIGFVSAERGWVGTADGGFETANGGSSWAPSALARRANRIRTHAADGTPMVYAIGSEVQVYR